MCESANYPWKLECRSIAMSYCRHSMDSVELLGIGLVGNCEDDNIKSDHTEQDPLGRSMRVWKLRRPILVDHGQRMQVKLRTLIDDNAVAIAAICRVPREVNTRQKVAIRALKRERRYQDTIYGANRHSVGEWILILQRELHEAHMAWISGGDNKAMEEILQVTAVGLACLEQCGAHERAECIEMMLIDKFGPDKNNHPFQNR